MGFVLLPIPSLSPLLIELAPFSPPLLSPPPPPFPLVELERSPVKRRDALDAEQDDHGVRRAAAVVGGETGPERQGALFP